SPNLSVLSNGPLALHSWLKKLRTGQRPVSRNSDSGDTGAMTGIVRIVAFVVVAMAAVAPTVLVRAADVELDPTIHHRMSRYMDAKDRFSFWYPAALRITVTAAN